MLRLPMSRSQTTIALSDGLIATSGVEVNPPLSRKAGDRFTGFEKSPPAGRIAACTRQMPLLVTWRTQPTTASPDGLIATSGDTSPLLLTRDRFTGFEKLPPAGRSTARTTLRLPLDRAHTTIAFPV